LETFTRLSEKLLSLVCADYLVKGLTHDFVHPSKMEYCNMYRTPGKVVTHDSLIGQATSTELMTFSVSFYSFERRILR
jgi:hypothetical protein